MPPGGELLFPAVPRLATIIAALVLAVPGSALAQDAGDDQYQDPFEDTPAQQESGGQAQSSQDGGLSESPEVGGGGGSGSSGSSGSGSAGEAGTQAAPAPTEQGTAQAPATEEATPQLPNTGSDPRALVLCGLAFVLIGVGLRLRTIDPDAY